MVSLACTEVITLVELENQPNSSTLGGDPGEPHMLSGWTAMQWLDFEAKERLGLTLENTSQ